MKRKILSGILSFFKPTAWALSFLCLCSSQLFAQQQQGTEILISGTVKSSDNNEPLPGVSVIIKGTAIGTTADAMGEYKLAAEKGSVLSFSFVGYQPFEATVGESSTINVSLVQDLTLLGEIVVTGYTSQSTRTISGAVSTITSKDLPDVSPVSMDRVLQGKIPGVTVSSEGTPGGNTMVRIRGFGTVNNNDPLYVIDGVPTKGNLSSLSPADIESVTVLKDASASSIYGSRAANGVVLITTKKGSATEPLLRISFNKGIQSVDKNRFPDLMNPQQLADAHRQRQLNGTGAFNHPAYGSNPNESVLPDYVNPIGFLAPDGETINGLNGLPVGNLNRYDLNDANGDGFLQIMEANKKGTDWFDEVYQQADFTNLSLNYSGGSEKGTYYIGTEYFDQEGVVMQTNFKRYSARINSVGHAKDWLDIGQSLNINYTEGVGLQNQYENGVLAMLYRLPSIIPVYDIKGNFAGNQSNAVGDGRNPVAELTYGKDNKTRIFRTFGNVFLEAEVLKGLRLKSLVGIDYTTNNGTYFTALNPGDYQSASTNSFNENNSFNSTIIWTNTLNYTRDIDAHSFSALLGTEYIENVFRQSASARQNYISDINTDLRYLTTGLGVQTNNGTGAKNNLSGYFGKLDYTFSDKYLASFTLRRDGSSRFGENNRWGTFPAASVGWIISDEPFLASIQSVKMLKLRAGWGQVGNQDIPDANGAYTLFSADVNYASYPIDGSNNKSVTGFDKIKRGNADVAWETTETLNIGLDAQLFDRIDLTFEWYKRKTSDMLVDVAQPAAGGAATNAFINVGDIENTGIELGLDYNSDVSKPFTYSIGVNFSTYRNTVKSLNSAPFYGARAFDIQYATITKDGYPISSFYGFQVDGIFNTAQEVSDHATQSGARPGTFRYKDVSGDGVINDLDRDIIGNPHPDFTYGFNINLGYKNFELNISGTGTQGNDIFNATKYFTHFWKSDGNRSTDLLNAWTPENTNTNIPQLNSNEVIIESQESSYYVEDGSFMRLRNVQLSYNLPKNILGNILSSAKIYIQGQNLLTLTKYSGLDPEINLRSFTNPTGNRSLGFDVGGYAIPRTFSAGVIIGL